MAKITKDMLVRGMTVYHVYAFSDRTIYPGWVEVKTFREFSDRGREYGYDFADFHLYGTWRVTGPIEEDEPFDIKAAPAKVEWRDQLMGLQTNSLMDMGIIENRYNEHQCFTELDEAWAYLMSRIKMDLPNPKKAA